MAEEKPSTENADRIFPQTEVRFGNPEEVHHLEFTLESMIQMKRITGRNPLNPELEKDEKGEIKKDEEGNPIIKGADSRDPEEIAIMLWAGLLHEGKFKTHDEVAAKIIFPRQLNQVCTAISLAMKRATSSEVPEKKTEAE